MDKKAYWIWLQHAFPAGSSKPKSIYNRFGSLEEFYKGGPELWATMSFINNKDIALLSAFNVNQAEAILEYCAKTEKTVLCPEDKLYPRSLFSISDPPAVLYVKGNMPDLDANLSISVVGSRKTSELCIELTEIITYELSKEGIIVISGGAVGIDTAAHKGALKGRTPTIAVLGCGLDFPYLMENELLRQKIVSKGGALITEYPPSMGVTKGTFQARNRIISALSRGTLIVSAEKKSGTMITARRALEQNRDVFAVPGNPLLPISEGPNSLIADGAIQVSKASDIIDHYSLFAESNSERSDEIFNIDEQLNLFNSNAKASDSPEMKEAAIKQIEEENLLDEKGLKLIRSLNFEPVHISEIEAKTSLKTSELLSLLTELELLGFIVSYSGQRFALKEI